MFSVALRFRGLGGTRFLGETPCLEDGDEGPDELGRGLPDKNPTGGFRILVLGGGSTNLLEPASCEFLEVRGAMVFSLREGVFARERARVVGAGLVPWRVILSYSNGV